MELLVSDTKVNAKYLLPANVPSTLAALAENQAKITSPKRGVVTVSPDVIYVGGPASTLTPVSSMEDIEAVLPSPKFIQSNIGYRIGGLPAFKDKSKAISTNKLRIDYLYLQSRLASKSEYMLLEGIESLVKIAYDLRYHRSAVLELFRGINDEREIIRDACINGLGQVAAISALAIILEHAEKMRGILTGLELEHFNQQISNAILAINEKGAMRDCMRRIHDLNYPVVTLESNVPRIYVFYHDWHENRNKIQ